MIEVKESMTENTLIGFLTRKRGEVTYVTTFERIFDDGQEFIERVTLKDDAEISRNRAHAGMIPEEWNDYLEARRTLEDPLRDAINAVQKALAKAGEFQAAANAEPKRRASTALRFLRDAEGELTDAIAALNGNAPAEERHGRVN